MTEFAAAVAEARRALDCFDRGEPVPRADGAAPVVTVFGERVEFPGLHVSSADLEAISRGAWLDWNAIREPAVLAEEAEMERRFGCTTRGEGGGGERRGRDDGRRLPVADFRPAHVRIRDALLRLGSATTRQIADEARTSNYTGSWLLKALRRGDVAHDRSVPPRWRWVGKRPSVIADGYQPERSNVKAETDAWKPEPPRLPVETDRAEDVTNNAADEPHEEVKTMGTPKVTDEEIIAAIGAGPTSTSVAATALGVTPEGLTPRLEALVKQGRLAGGERGSGTGRPRMWSAPSATKRGPARGDTTTPREIRKRVVRALRPLVGKRLVDDAPPTRPTVDIEISQATGDRLIEFAREIENAIIHGAQRRVAAALRAEADRLDAEAAGSAA